MSIQAQILNSILRKFVKSERQKQKDYSYTDARKLMNQPGYEDQNTNFVSKFLAKKIFGKKQSNINIEEIYLDNIRTLKFSSSSFTTNKCILYFHGGGYIAGSPETHQNFLTHLCKISEIPIYAIDYSLAPENPYPAALNDAVSSFQSILKIGYNPENIFIGGDSAGGNLTLVCALKLQKINQKLPSKLFLLSPWTDLTASGESIKFNAEKDPYLSYDNFLTTGESSKKAVQDWYAPGQDYSDPMISPVFADYESFPETLIQVSDIEILLSDAINLREKLKENNNSVSLKIYKNVPHVWQVFGFLPEAKEATKEISTFLNS